MGPRMQLNDFSSPNSHSLDDLKQEVSQLNSQLRKLLTDLSNAVPEVKDTFEYFVEVSSSKSFHWSSLGIANTHTFLPTLVS